MLQDALLCGISTAASQQIKHALNQSVGPAAISCPTLSAGTVDHMLSLGRLQPAILNIGAGSAPPVLPDTPQIAEELPVTDRQEVRPRAICPHLLSATAVADARQVPPSLQNGLNLASCRKLVRAKREL